MRAYWEKHGYVTERIIPVDPAIAQELNNCRASFRHFLRYWKFINRESGAILNFSTLWPGQEIAAEAMENHPWLFLLKAGKLGFTELECAFDGWRALFGGDHMRVNLLSKSLPSAQELLDLVEFGLTNLPDFIQRPFKTGEAGGQTSKSLKMRGWNGDTITVASYAAVKNTAIDVSARHTHLDELSHVLDPKAVWDSISTTVSPIDGTIHIVTRGAGNDVYTAELWAQTQLPNPELYGVFVPYSGRPGRDEEWYAKESNKLGGAALKHWAPTTPEDALAGTEDVEFVPIEAFDVCYDGTLGEEPPPNVSLVMGIDAGVSHDQFAISIVGINPNKPDEHAARYVKRWLPSAIGGKVDFNECEDWIRLACQKWRIVCIVYDPFQLAQMMQRLTRDGVAWCDPFSQQNERVLADTQLRESIMNRQFAHNGNEFLREDIRQAGAQYDETDDRRLRVIKRKATSHIDCVVATSMALRKASKLNLV